MTNGKLYGYNIEREDNQVILSRSPLRRFDDLQDFDSMKIIKANEEEYLDNIIKIITGIKEEYSTVLPDDIAIIFLEQNNKENYDLANRVSIIVKEKFNWNVNKGYETKEKVKDTLFISNRNNVKGLEFPFVICVTKNQINISRNLRNSIYMMLTRSFLTSYFIIPNNDPSVERLKQGLEKINETGKLSVIEPTKEQRKAIKDIMINQENLSKSIREIVDEIIEEKGIDKSKTKRINAIVEAFIGENDDWSKEFIEEIISNNINII